MSKKYQPYKHWEISEFDKNFTRQIEKYKDCPEWVEIIAKEAVYSTEWKPLWYDGCTAVQDTYHPCLACFIHDYLWRTGRGGIVSDQIFHDLMILDGTGKSKAWFRWFGVRLVWLFFYKWKRMSKRSGVGIGFGVFMYLQNRKK